MKFRRLCNRSCLCVYVSIRRITGNSADFIETRCYDCAYHWEESNVPDVFSYSYRPLFPKVGEMTNADNGNENIIHFGSDPTDTRFRINLEIRIRITDHFCS